MVTVVLEVLREGNHVRHVLSEMSAQVPYFDCVRITSGHQRRPRRIADSLLTVRALEYHASPCQTIHVGSYGMRVAVAAHLRAKVVDGDEQHVAFRRAERGAQCRSQSSGSYNRGAQGGDLQ
jgi:hypothetical protein